MAHPIRPFSITMLLIFSTSITMATAATDATLVLDVEGNPLKVGSSYYVRTELSKFGVGGGLVVASKPNHAQCPQYVAQSAVGYEGETPMTFLPSNPSQKHIHISSDLYIVSNTTSSVCSKGAWQLTPDSNTGNLFVSTGDINGKRSPQMHANNRFRIERSFVELHSSFYQLAYCPSSRTTKIACGVIDAIDFTNDLVWLGLLSDPNPNFFHLLSFVKA